MAAISSKYLKWFLTETTTGLIYYLDSMGNLQRDTIMSGIDRSLPEAPDGWQDLQITYARNMIYWGVNRSFTVPLKFVGDGARIIRQLFYAGRGPEQPITLVICKYDETIGAFTLEYSGQLDLTNNVNIVAESITVNVMEGGILQLLKSYENTIVELPCDGSIPENIKFLADGIKFNDVFHYQVPKLQSPFAGVQPLPLTFISNDGDNIAVIHRDQNLENPYANYTAKSANALFTTINPMTVRITGSISVMSDPNIHNTAFYMYAVSSVSQPHGVGGATNAVGLTLPQNQTSGGVQVFDPVDSQVNIDGQRTYSFDETINLGANENLFIMYLNDFVSNPLRLLGGQINLTFSSRLAPSRVWGMTAANVWKLIGQRLCALASTTDYPFSFPFQSDFLNQLERFVITSGDAIRASTNPNYYQYYNIATLNPQNPNNTDFNQSTTLGPTIRISISDFFNSLNPIKPSAIGNQKNSSGVDSIFFEDRGYVLDSSRVTMELGQVNNLQITPDEDNFFNWLEIGYAANQYDETSGKYEYNNTSQFQAPVKSRAKVFQLVSKKGRTDSYGFELTRYNTQGGKSTTFNQSDTDWWFINTDFSASIYNDFYSAVFSSVITDTTSNVNTNLILNKGLAYQPVICGTLDGEYFVNGNDFSIFMLNQPTASLPTGGNLQIQVTLAALLNGLAGDSATISFWINGVKQQTWSASITSVNTPLNATYTITRPCVQGDNFWFTVDTVRTCTVQINQCSLNVGSGYFIAQNSGPINYQAGVSEQLIPLPLVTALTVIVDGSTYQVVSYGFQYFRFLSNVSNRNFNWSLALKGFIQGFVLTENITLALWKNGVQIGSVIYNATALQSTWNAGDVPQFSGSDTYNDYDMYWITASCTNCGAWITNINFVFTSQIPVYKLNRENYSNVSGIPNPETAFNIPDLTPMRMLMSNGSILRSILYMIGPHANLKFQTADKNQFLSTTLNGVTITENATIDVATLGDPFWLPLILQFETAVPWTAKQIFDAAANGHISFIWKGKKYYGFPLEVTVKPALNDSQQWKLLASPANLVSDFINLEWDGIMTLNFLDSMIPYINPIHFLPNDFSKPAQYNTYSMDEDWFVNRIKDYCDKNNYFSPWQLNDTINMQCQTAGLAPVTIQVLNSKGQPVGSPINCPQVTSARIQPPQAVYQVSIPLNTFVEGKYYFLWTMGTGAATATWISEGIWVKSFWPKTQLYEFTNSRDKQAAIFNSDNPWKPNKRFFSQINKYVPKTVFKVYVDEPQDIQLQNAISYDTWTLEAGFGSGMPDYDLRKFDRIFSLDTVLVDANQYSRDADAQTDITYIDGQAKGYVKLIIRKAQNQDGITFNTAGQIEGPQQAGYTIDAQAFGQNNSGQNLIQVTAS